MMFRENNEPAFTKQGVLRLPSCNHCQLMKIFISLHYNTNVMKKAILFVIGCFALTSAYSQPVKKVLLEEFTTTLCGFCPPKSDEIVTYFEVNPLNTLFMTHHAGFGTDS